MAKKPITALSSVFIDTGVFIDLLKVDYTSTTPDVHKRIEQTKKFFRALEELKKKIVFQTSAINIAEIFNFGKTEESAIAAVLTVLGGNDFEVIAFDETAAMYHNQHFGSILGNSSIEVIKKEVNYTNGIAFANIKDRIRKDILIASCAKQFEADIVLTNDSGFKLLCDKLKVDCHLFTGNDADFHSSASGDKIYNFA